MSQNQPTQAPGNNPGNNPQANPGNNQPPATTNPPAATNTPAPASSTSRLSINPNAPAGMLTITQPAQSVTSYYKIGQGQLVTFGWEFSFLISTPASLTVSAVASGNTYPVGPTDGIIPGTATEVVWDVYAYQQKNPNLPLVEATYTLNIHDERGMNAGNAPGHLKANSGLQFALYTPQPYTGLADGEF